MGPAVWTNQGAIYDPIANDWTIVAAPPGWNNVGDAQCAVLASGILMLASPFDTRSALLDPVTLTWTANTDKTGTPILDKNVYPWLASSPTIFASSEFSYTHNSELKIQIHPIVFHSMFRKKIYSRLGLQQVSIFPDMGLDEYNPVFLSMVGVLANHFHFLRIQLYS